MKLLLLMAPATVFLILYVSIMFGSTEER